MSKMMENKRLLDDLRDSLKPTSYRGLKQQSTQSGDLCAYTRAKMSNCDMESADILHDCTGFQLVGCTS
jgi:hypothetical protein